MFPIFNDVELDYMREGGLMCHKLKPMDMDNDCSTDEEQIGLAKRKLFSDVH